MQLQVPNFHNTVYKPEGKPKAAVLILHGMKEHSGRYAGFAQYLRNQSYLVLTYDQPGHGQTPKTKEDLGYISSTHPAQHLVKAAKEMSEFLIGQYPGLPIFLLGHSMGSFVARVLLKSSFSLFKGVVLIGSGDSNLLARLAIFPLWLLNIFVPKKEVLGLMNSLPQLTTNVLKKKCLTTERTGCLKAKKIGKPFFLMNTA